MPLVDLSDDDLKRAALSARAQAHRHQEQAKNGEGSKELHRDQARRFGELARRLEEARKASPGS